jgi:hypothetical protein
MGDDDRRGVFLLAVHQRTRVAVRQAELTTCRRVALPRGQLDRSRSDSGARKSSSRARKGGVICGTEHDDRFCSLPDLTAVPPPVQSTGTPSIADKSVIVIIRSSSFASLAPR